MTDKVRLYERIIDALDINEADGCFTCIGADTDELAIICADFDHRLQAAQTRVAELERNNALMAEQLIARQE